MEKLSQILWRERELLETLLYKLEVEQLVMATGRTRWLLQAAKDVESVLETIRETELVRAVAADEAAEVLGLAPNPSLRALIDAADEPWTTILADHRDAFARITTDVTTMADANRELITAGIRSARETLLTMTEGTDGYSADGSAVVGLARKPLLDRSL
ncbi:flagellar protein FlgN [Nocardioides jishulii]|uniref:Flagellar protein FlgN n=1 Tax=Nocardioides jishulii TaxID=2575440 RepID=A0A4U2YTY0_9ACTN|nr:flagellar protein FlgN [Nocardioides jishulii]QCX28573.1 flagellar protein FlgN [Nocardioides jishulii]TKI64534.1 flagellar protein FlgN [Nocardioides jishulii]